MEVTINSQNIEVSGHKGTWYTIATKNINGIDYFLMEHEKYGDKAPNVILNSNGVLVLEGVANGFVDLEDLLAGEKQRLFIDMDGTLAVFRPVDQLETLYEYGYFANLPPQKNVVDAVKEILKNQPEIEVFILSAHLADSPYALTEKNQWLDQYLPEIDAAHRIFPPCGVDKKDFIPGGIRASDILLDDYTHNLTLWEPPALGIKLLNGINHTKGTWQGNRIHFDGSPAKLAEKIVRVANGDNVFDNSHQQEAHIKQSKSTILSKSAAQIMAAGYEPYYDKDGFYIFRNPKSKGLQFYKAGFEKVNGKYECRFQQLNDLKDLAKHKDLMPEQIRDNI